MQPRIEKLSAGQSPKGDTAAAFSPSCMKMPDISIKQNEGKLDFVRFTHAFKL
jgi:hypothetical protein